jgi:hypothetical protein
MAKLLESGCALIVGTVDLDGLPEATRAWGARVPAGGSRVRFLVNSDDDRSIDNLRTGGAVALTATDVPTLKSVQVKGRAVLVENATEDDLETTRQYQAGFFEAVEATEGTPVALLSRLVPAAFTAVECTVEELFDQTPGPTAGARLTPDDPTP